MEILRAPQEGAHNPQTREGTPCSTISIFILFFFFYLRSVQTGSLPIAEDAQTGPCPPWEGLTSLQLDRREPRCLAQGLRVPGVSFQLLKGEEAMPPIMGV